LKLPHEFEEGITGRREGPPHPLGRGTGNTGRLREPMHYLSRANIVVITRSNLVTENEIENLRSAVTELGPNAVFTAHNKIARLVALQEFFANGQGNSTSYEEQNSFAFCALGNPQNFFEQLKQDGFIVAATEAFGDHHIYAQQDIERIEEAARTSGCEMLLTTAKDAVKVKDLKFTLRCFVVEIEMVIDDADAFAEMI